MKLIFLLRLFFQRLHFEKKIPIEFITTMKTIVNCLNSISIECFSEQKTAMILTVSGIILSIILTAIEKVIWT